MTASFEKWLSENRPEKCTRHEVALAERAFSAGAESMRDERLALVWPSVQESEKARIQNYNGTDLIAWRSAENYFRANVKAVVVNDVSDEELNEISLRECAEEKRATWEQGYRAALKKMRDEG